MWSKNEVGINAVIFILFTHHNFKLYLEWSSDATQRYFAECRMQNAKCRMALFSMCKRSEKTI